MKAHDTVSIKTIQSSCLTAAAMLPSLWAVCVHGGRGGGVRIHSLQPLGVESGGALSVGVSDHATARPLERT